MQCLRTPLIYPSMRMRYLCLQTSLLTTIFSYIARCRLASSTAEPSFPFFLPLSKASSHVGLCKNNAMRVTERIRVEVGSSKLHLGVYGFPIRFYRSFRDVENISML